MTFYERMAETASRMIALRGDTVTLPRTTGGTSPDPVTGEFTTGTPANRTTMGIIKPYAANLIDGTRIKATDRMLILTSQVEPLMTDKPEMGGDALGSIINITTIKPASTPLVYFLQLRL